MPKIDRFVSKGDFVRLAKEDKVVEVDRFIDVLFSNVNLESKELILRTSRQLELLLENVDSDQKKVLQKIGQSMSISNWLDEENTSFIPPRLHVVLFCFLMGAKQKFVDALLMSCGYERLNARSIVDATILFSLNKKHSVNEWMTLFIEADHEYQRLTSHQNQMSDRMTVASLRAYYYSQKKINDAGELQTISPTGHINASILAVKDRTELVEVIAQNINFMHDYRAKSRLRMIESLLFYVDGQIKEFINRMNTYQTEMSVFSEKELLESYKRLVFKGKLSNGVYLSDIIDKRASHKVQLSLQHFESLRIMSSYVCDNYSVYYHQSNLLNDDLKPHRERSIGSKQKNALSEKTHSNEAISDSDDLEEGVTRNLTDRRAFNSFEKLLMGKADPSRKFLISFLIFSGIRDVHTLNEKLTSCGFDNLDSDRFSDRFFMEFLVQADKHQFLYELAEISAAKGTPFILDGFSDSLINDIETARKSLRAE